MAGSVRPGFRFGRLVVATEAEPYFWRGRFARRRWLCACDCGGEAEVREDSLKTGHTVSCGCLRNEATRERATRHGNRAGYARTPEYHAWQSLLHRHAEAPVCRRWKARGGVGFANFLEDVGRRPSPDHRLVRPDARRSFGPGNCAWAASPARRGVPRRLLQVGRRSLTLQDAAARHGIRYDLLCKRLQRGWPVARALSP